MVNIVDGKAIAELGPSPRCWSVRLNGTVCRVVSTELLQAIAAQRERDPRFAPCLAVVQVGDHRDSNVYIRMKKIAAAKVNHALQETDPNH